MIMIMMSMVDDDDDYEADDDDDNVPPQRSQQWSPPPLSSAALEVSHSQNRIPLGPPDFDGDDDADNDYNIHPFRLEEEKIFPASKRSSDLVLFWEGFLSGSGHFWWGLWSFW